MSKSSIKVSKALQSLVAAKKNIKTVYFNENGDHFTMAHEIELHEVDDQGYSTGVKKVKSLGGAKKTVVKIVIDKARGKKIDKLVNTEYTPVFAEMSREEILKATPENEFMSDAKKIEILKQAALISKEDGFKELLAQINSATSADGEEKGKKK